MTCDDLAKKCKAGDKKACEMYKKKCGKVKQSLFPLLNVHNWDELEDILYSLESSFFANTNRLYKMRIFFNSM